MTQARRLGLLVVALIFGLDQASKLWLLFGVRLAENGPFAPTSFMEIVLAWNRGISYGLFQQYSDFGRWTLVVVSFIAAAWLGRWMWRETRTLTVVSLALIIGGALGNGVDRAVYGAVVDFVHLHYGSFSWYIFNLADAAIVVGVAGLLYESVFPETRSSA
ncbi:signal peptidase II [Bosea sp. PAMC 26642]|uniref:signal peptidase II n=1 Tax=Bosea sp. (strain PAMC 26642) TaxID=1792307 RepID=UPI0007704738|nr:signal peptidase II [Bosea sp. PAMC 26642]AMJ58917.1 signal peptidase II [Bosea sp. PAMC 26642]